MTVTSTSRRTPATLLRASAVASLAALVLASAPLTSSAAPPPGAPGAADAPAAAAALPATVSADALPTVQVDGVVWSQVIVGGRVYVTGSFATARPAGAAPGERQVPRANLLAFDLATGDLVPGWAPSLNAQGLAITASADGKTLYVGGDFTTVDGAARPRLVALDAATGAVVPGFAPTPNARVRALAVSDGTLYAGGSFTTVSGQPRSRLVALRGADGAVTAWEGGADAEVLALTAPAGAGSLVVGGRFTTLGGARAYGLGALDLGSGASRPFAANAVVRDAGRDAGIWSLADDGARVYGSGYVYGRGGNLENAFAADARTGALAWVNGCRGDTYSVAPAGPVLYATGHPHDCSMVGANPETRPRTWQRAQAMTVAAARTNTSGAFSGRPAPELLHWLPTLRAGSYTGQGQAGWAVSAADGWVVLGGEFPVVNGLAQQGLVRFRARAQAPNSSGPVGYDQLQPTATVTGPGRVSLAWQAAWDRDDADLVYEVLRQSGGGAPAVVATQTAGSTWWSRPALAAADGAAPGGDVTYRVRVSDPSGNAMTSRATTVTVPAPPAEPPGQPPAPPVEPPVQPPAPTGAYDAAVAADAPAHHWRLDEPSGTAAADSTGAAALTLDPSTARGTPGATGDGDLAVSLPGTATVPGTTTAPEQGPQTFTVEVWLRSGRTSTGGKLLGFGDSATGLSGSYDRQLWMGDDGRVRVGVNDGSLRTLTTPARLDDGSWHHVAATLGTGGLALHVDGVRVAADAGAVRAQPFAGYWRLGGDSVASWPGAPTATSFTGDLDEAAVYPRPLSAQRIAAHVAASGRAPAPPPPS